MRADPVEMSGQYQIEAWNQPLRFECQDIPIPTGAEVLVRVHMCGVCHSDLHVWHGPRPGARARSLPFVMGHEVFGAVEALGPDAEPIEIGSGRIVFPWIGCGECITCRSGEEVNCESPRSLGTRVAGGYGTHVLVPHARYLVDPGGLAPELAATLACSGLTAYSAFKKLPSLRADDWLLIVGAGGVGLAALGVAKALSPARVAVVDIDAAKREQALAMGADLVFDGSNDGATGVPRMTAVLDFVGHPQTVSSALNRLRKGGAIIVVGLYGGEITLPVETLAFRNMRLAGSLTGTLSELKELVVLAASGSLKFVPVATRPFHEINQMLRDLEEGRVLGRVVAVNC